MTEGRATRATLTGSRKKREGLCFTSHSALPSRHQRRANEDLSCHVTYSVL